MKTFDRHLLDSAVHPLELTVGARVVRLGQPVLDVVCFVDHVEAHLTRPGGGTGLSFLGSRGEAYEN